MEPEQLQKKRRKDAPLLGVPPDSLAALRGPEDLHCYNLDALKKIARMGSVSLPKNAPRAVCMERLTADLFGGARVGGAVQEEEDDEVHTVNLSCPL